MIKNKIKKRLLDVGKSLPRADCVDTDATQTSVEVSYNGE